MPFLDHIAVRDRKPEIMDQPDLDPGKHRHALRGLERINFLSASASILWPPLAKLARRLAPRPVRALDIATGAGDLPIRLWHKAQRSKLNLHFDGLDVSPEAVAYARARAAEQHADVQFHRGDALNQPLPEGYDVLFCSLFLHHLETDQAVELLRRMSSAARHMVLVNDLERGRLGYILAQVATRLLTTSSVVHVDGPRSVEAAFTVPEAREIAERAGLRGATIVRRWPFRYLLVWNRT